MYAKAVRTLHQGGIVAYPTETFYGLAVDPTNASAVRSLYALKNREAEKALTFLVPDLHSLSPHISSIPASYGVLMQTFWPGPLTLVFEARGNSLLPVKADDNSVAIRISSNPIAQTFCQQWGHPITASSANLSGAPALSSAEAVRELWGDAIDYVLDGGDTKGGKPSTIVKQSSSGLTVVREGAIPSSTIFNTIS